MLTSHALGSTLWKSKIVRTNCHEKRFTSRPGTFLDEDLCAARNLAKTSRSARLGASGEVGGGRQISDDDEVPHGIDTNRVSSL